MTSQAECRSHAALCKQLAQQEPTNRCIWTAEAEYWLRLSKKRLRGAARTKTASDVYPPNSLLGVSSLVNFRVTASRSTGIEH